MSRSEVYNIKGGRSKVKGDGILSVIPGTPLMIMENIDIPLGLVNGAIVEFCGFADSDGALIRDEIIATSAIYILIKLKHDVGVEIALPGLRQTYRWVIVDLKKPNGGYSPTSSPYIQLSRAKTLASLSILRPFDPAELQSSLSKNLLAELEWQAQKAKETEDLYM